MVAEVLEGLTRWFGERSLLADALWQTTLLLAVGLVAARLLASRPARAHAVLVACSLAAVAAPLASLAARRLGWGLFDAPVVAASGGPLPAAGDLALPAGSSLAQLLSRASVAAWAVASVLVLARSLVGVLHARRLAARSGRPAPTEIRTLVRRAARRSGIAPAPRTLAAAPSLAPCVWAWSRPARLYLPDRACSGRPHELSAAIHHELAHLRRRDHLSQLALQVSTALLCWQPLAWLARRRAAAFAEQACDEWALASGVAPAAMAHALVSAVPTGAVAGLALHRDRRLLEQRIEHVFRAREPRPRTGGPWSAAAAACVASLLAGVALAQRAAPLPTSQLAEPLAAPGALAGEALVEVDPWAERVAELAAAGIVDVVVQPGEVDLGLVAPGTTAAGKLWLVNPGDSPREVLGVKTGCGCTRVHLPEPAIVPAGGVLALDVDQDAETKPDTAKSKLVTLRIAGQDPIQVPVKTHTTPLAAEETVR